MKAPFSGPRRPSASRRLPNIAIWPRACSSAPTQRFLPELIKRHTSTSSGGEYVESINQLRRLVIAMRTYEQMSIFMAPLLGRGMYHRMKELGPSERSEIYQRLQRVRIERAKVLEAIIDGERLRLSQSDPTIQSLGPSRQILAAIQAIEQKRNADAAKPGSQLTSEDLTTIKTKLCAFSDIAKTIAAMGIVAKVVLPLRFLYWAFGIGSCP